jgi:hypothetical protein
MKNHHAVVGNDHADRTNYTRLPEWRPTHLNRIQPRLADAFFNLFKNFAERKKKVNAYINLSIKYKTSNIKAIKSKNGRTAQRHPAVYLR